VYFRATNIFRFPSNREEEKEERGNEEGEAMMGWRGGYISPPTTKAES
jgi:hypothetical protein